ncbi:MAG: hypothetical protein IJ975_00130, partial [Clostridia bacterium]|nr:hypothetical protein [Clostridia bacterium]
MIKIEEVKTKKQLKAFVDFPTKLYENCPQYVHPLRMDEISSFNPAKNVNFEDCEAICFLAYENDRVVGRIAAIIQKAYNKKVNEKRVRFSRFDSVNNQKVADALFQAAETWAKAKGMNIVHGPLGFNDLDREGLLIDGFDEIATFEEQYNYPYYQTLIENCGYVKEKDWLEYKIFVPKQPNERINRMSEAVLKRYNLKIADTSNKYKFIDHYKAQIFEVLDEAYCSLHGVVPFNDKMREQIISQFKMFINKDFIIVLVDENDRVVAFGFAIPSLSEAISKSKGRITPPALCRVLKAVKHPKIVDFALVGVRDEYQSRGLTAVIMKHIIDVMTKYKIEYAETNLNLEDNIKIQQTWKNFE